MKIFLEIVKVYLYLPDKFQKYLPMRFFFFLRNLKKLKIGFTNSIQQKK